MNAAQLQIEELRPGAKITDEQETTYQPSRPIVEELVANTR